VRDLRSTRHVLDRALTSKQRVLAKKKKIIRREWTKNDIELKAHSKLRTPVAKIAKENERLLVR
jgi:hypothetical protein